MDCRESEDGAGLSDCLYPRNGGEAGKGIGGGAGGGCFGVGSFLARRAHTKNTIPRKGIAPVQYIR